MKLNSFLYLAVGLSILSCNQSAKKTTATVENTEEKIVELPERGTYQETEKRVYDLLHTKLHVSFDWANRQMKGNAELSIKPFFHTVNTLELDAKHMIINEVALLDSMDKKSTLSYTYDEQVLKIELGKNYTRKDTMRIFIDYIARPEEVTQKGSSAINDAKGLYFINYDGTHPTKPTQLWTQGETESASCWFPTVDVPNEKMTQEIYITVDNKYKTCSNGALLYSSLNADGTRTDYWKQDQDHSPYLAMMAVGDFTVIEHDWEDIKIHYYVEAKDSMYAELVFGRTPEMLTFFSEKLGYKYPWEKFDQIIARDFISGAMENTSAVIHGEFVMQDSTEYLDGNYEDYVAHELFHHWFGDLITCESWSNLPLNESFATYGEYLWREHKYGQEFADQGVHSNLQNYLRESKREMKDMIRFNYEDKEDMFDNHSYDKGGTILHMLRNYLGDDAFFSSIEYYLHQHAFKNTEIHDLRQAFEDVTGEDLNWFFNQWFLAKGHPVLEYSYVYDDEVDSIYVRVQQKQNFEEVPLYKLPIDIDIYFGSKAKRHRIVATEVDQTFALPSAGEPNNVNFDATKSITCEKTEVKTEEEWAHQYEFGKIYRDRYDAYVALLRGSIDSTTTVANQVFWMAMDDKNMGIRTVATYYSSKIHEKDSFELKEKLIALSQKDIESEVRNVAIIALAEKETDQMVNTAIRKSFNDPSNMVKGSAIEFLFKHDEDYLMNKIHLMDKEYSNDIVRAVSKVYAEEGDEKYRFYFEDKWQNFETNKYYFYRTYIDFLKKQSESEIQESIVLIKEIATDTKHRSSSDRDAATRVLVDLLTHYSKRITDLEKDIADQANVAGQQTNLPGMKLRLERVSATNEVLKSAMKSVLATMDQEEQEEYKESLLKVGVKL